MGEEGKDEPSSDKSTQKPVGGNLVLDRADYGMDGFRSWLVLCGAFYGAALHMGFITTFGSLYFRVLQTEFGLTDTETAAMPSLVSGLATTFGLLSPLLYNSIGCRLSVLLGAATTTLALLSAAAAQSHSQLCISFACLGVGFSLSLLPANAALVEYFERWRIFALTFGSVGAGVGTATLPDLSLFFVTRYGWRASLGITAGLTAQLTVVAALARSRRKREYAASIQRMFRLHLFRLRTFLAVSLMCVLFGGTSVSFFVYYAKVMYGTGSTEESVTMVMRILGVVNMLARAGASLLNQAQCTNRVLLASVSGLLMSISVGAFAWAGDLASFGLIAGVFGAGTGLLYAGTRALVLELFGADCLASANGLCVFSLGVGMLIFPSQMTGRIAAAASYKAAFGVVGGLGVVGSALAFAVFAARLRMRLRSSPKSDLTQVMSVQSELFSIADMSPSSSQLI